VADISEELVRVLGGLRGRSSEVRLISTVLGRAVAGDEVDASYWGRNVREPVRFRAAMQELPPASREKLRIAQRAWLAFVEKNSAAMRVAARALGLRPP